MELWIGKNQNREVSKLSLPKSIPDQVQAVREYLEKEPGPASAERIARQFKRARTERVRELLETL